MISANTADIQGPCQQGDAYVTLGGYLHRTIVTFHAVSSYNFLLVPSLTHGAQVTPHDRPGRISMKRTLALGGMAAGLL
ncbi:hypothetical protein, partial [Microbispora amethystogenes]|uniref:hypothetical protein n=1 Tax=Microbispora amethystogenes TaxID=1427754 RepID=UPI0031E678EE